MHAHTFTFIHRSPFLVLPFDFSFASLPRTEQKISVTLTTRNCNVTRTPESFNHLRLALIDRVWTPTSSDFDFMRIECVEKNSGHDDCSEKIRGRLWNINCRVPMFVCLFFFLFYNTLGKERHECFFCFFFLLLPDWVKSEKIIRESKYNSFTVWVLSWIMHIIIVEIVHKASSSNMLC